MCSLAWWCAFVRLTSLASHVACSRLPVWGARREDPLGLSLHLWRSVLPNTSCGTGTARWCIAVFMFGGWDQLLVTDCWHCMGWRRRLNRISFFVCQGSESGIGRKCLVIVGMVWAGEDDSIILAPLLPKIRIWPWCKIPMSDCWRCMAWRRRANRINLLPRFRSWYWWKIVISDCWHCIGWRRRVNHISFVAKDPNLVLVHKL